MSGATLHYLRHGFPFAEAERRILEWWHRGYVLASDLGTRTTRLLRRPKE
jgi:hypothetical protein